METLNYFSLTFQQIIPGELNLVEMLQSYDNLKLCENLKLQISTNLAIFRTTTTRHGSPLGQNKTKNLEVFISVQFWDRSEHICI